jgi:hypothetical protein
LVSAETKLLSFYTTALTVVIRFGLKFEDVEPIFVWLLFGSVHSAQLVT